MSFNQSTNNRSNTLQRPNHTRPTTSMASHFEEDGDQLSQKETGKGMLPPSHVPPIQSSHGYPVLQVKKLRDSKSMHSLRSSQSLMNMRDASVSTAMGMLRIDEDSFPHDSQNHQASNGAAMPPSTSTLSHKYSISSGLRNLRIDSTENALVLFQAPGDSLVAPKTPSQIPVLSKMEAVVATPATPKTPKKSPQKTPYLSKTSNIPAFTEFNVQGRLDSIEAMFSDLKDKFSGSAAERNGLEDAVAIYRTRGMLSPDF